MVRGRPEYQTEEHKLPGQSVNPVISDTIRCPMTRHKLEFRDRERRARTLADVTQCIQRDEGVSPCRCNKQAEPCEGCPYATVNS